MELESVIGGLENAGVLIGDSSWGPIVGALGLVVTLDSTGLPPFPIKVTRGGTVSQWSASFEAVESSGVSIGTAATVYADLLHAPALTSTPEVLSNINFTVIDTINLGDIPLIGAFEAYTNNQTLATPVNIAPGDYLIVHFYVDSLLVSSVTGFHAQASVEID